MAEVWLAVATCYPVIVEVQSLTRPANLALLKHNVLFEAGSFSFQTPCLKVYETQLHNLITH